jgi:NAD-dependent DNA ligase
VGTAEPRGTWQGSRHNGSSVDGTRKPLPSANPDADPDGALCGLTVCLTRRLASMTREEAQDRLAAVGAQPAAGVSRKTHILVSAEQANLLPGSSISGKAAKAQELLSAGHDIEVIDEVEFLQRLQS